MLPVYARQGHFLLCQVSAKYSLSRGSMPSMPAQRTIYFCICRYDHPCVFCVLLFTCHELAPQHCSVFTEGDQRGTTYCEQCHMWTFLVLLLFTCPELAPQHGSTSTGVIKGTAYFVQCHNRTSGSETLPACAAPRGYMHPPQQVLGLCYYRAIGWHTRHGWCV